ncbi:MAG: hypothetical protein QJR02_01970 [Sinobacteraceae bacterium]|nr:hypothetical protein [Nevskiaceae bacterium]
MKHAPFSLLFFVGVMCWVAWIVFATDANARIARGCAPIRWSGSVSVSLTAFIYAPGQAGVQKFFDRTDYACRFSVWRLLYEDEWRKAHPGQPLPGSAEERQKKMEQEDQQTPADSSEAPK